MEKTMYLHDSLLIGYEITSRKNIIIKTEYRENNADANTVKGRTLVTFSGIVAYQFIDDAFEAGTILDGINEIEPQRFLNGNRKRFENSYNHWVASDHALELFKQKDLHVYEILSSLGMYGWVLSKSYQVTSQT
jgi:hypothetical protein